MLCVCEKGEWDKINLVSSEHNIQTIWWKNAMDIYRVEAKCRIKNNEPYLNGKGMS